MSAPRSCAIRISTVSRPTPPPTAARFAFAEYGRWTRQGDRKCNLVGKENVPLGELESAEDCLADYLKHKADEIGAAKGDPKKVFGRQVAARAPDTDAVDFCAARIHAANSCGNFLRINRVYALDSQVGEQEAQVEGSGIGLATCSKIATTCTGTCWDARTGRPQPGVGNKERSADAFNVTRRLRIQRTFAFVKAADGWRCREDELAPVNSGTAGGGS